MDYMPKGILNLGNTCYINACIQILCKIDKINNIVQNVPIKNITKVETLLWKNWKDIVSIMNEKESDNPEKQLVVQPNGFITAVEQVSASHKKTFFQPQEPQDISEYLLFFIDSLHECISDEYTVQISGQSKSEIDNLALEVYQATKKAFEKKFSEIAKIFYGVQVSQLTTVDGRTVHSRNCEIFFLLDLPILYENTGPYSIYDCLDEYTKTESLDGDNKWYNEKTHKHEAVKKSLSFWSLPEVLIICLKRSQFDGEKSTAQIQYPLELDLRKYIVGYRKSEFVYELTGVCIHIGSITNGHYMAFVKNHTHWFFCNDETVQIVEDVKHLQTNLAHCLFYVKKNNAI